MEVSLAEAPLVEVSLAEASPATAPGGKRSAEVALALRMPAPRSPRRTAVSRSTLEMASPPPSSAKARLWLGRRFRRRWKSPPEILERWWDRMMTAGRWGRWLTGWQRRPRGAFRAAGGRSLRWPGHRARSVARPLAKSLHPPHRSASPVGRPPAPAPRGVRA